MAMPKGHKVGSNSRLALRHKDKSGYSPTDKDRINVFNMCGYGMTHVEIASVLGITAATLRRYFQHQLDVAKLHKVNKVARRLYLDALKSGNTKAQIFFLSTQYAQAYSTNKPVPVEPIEPPTVDYSKLTLQELDTLRDIMAKAEAKTIDITPGKSRI